MCEERHAGGGANVTVDRLEARLALLEAELNTLREQLGHQQHDSAVLQQQVQALTQQLNQHVAGETQLPVGVMMWGLMF